MHNPYRISHMFCALLATAILCATTTYAVDADLTARLHKLTPATDTTLSLPGYERLAGGETAGVALAPGPAGSFDSLSVGSPDVHFDGSIYRMWYCGSAVACYYVGGESSIGLATSKDGINWKRANGGKPVLGPGKPGAFDELRVEGGCVLYDEDSGIWSMWYTGLRKPGTEPRASNWEGTIPAGWECRLRVGLATSTDGIHWERQNDGKPVIELGAIGSTGDLQVMYPTVVKEEDGYRMWYASNSITIPHTVSMATSPDGIRWTKHRSGAPVEGLGWYVTGPAVTRLGNEYLMLCSPEDLEMNVWIVRAAVSRDGFNWDVLNQGKSVAPAGGDIQFEGKRVAEEGSTHHPSSAIRRGNDLLFWYTENAGQGKGYRIAAGKLAGQWPKGE
jgi:hypothetical protein